MYSYIIGKLVEIGEGYIVLENNGIGYEINVSDFTMQNLQIGESVKIYTYYVVREDNISLIGFTQKLEKDMFKKLITVSGIGPKGALTILSGAKIDDIALAIVNGDSGFLSKIKGVGKKTSERIIVELREKVDVNFDALPEISNASENQNVVREAIIALSSLGLNSMDASRLARENYEAGISVENLVMKSLRSMGK